MEKGPGQTVKETGPMRMRGHSDTCGIVTALPICSRVFYRYSMTSPIGDVHAELHQRFLFLSDRIPSKFSGQSHSTMLRGHNGLQFLGFVTMTGMLIADIPHTL